MTLEKITSLQKKRETLIANNIIRADLLENIRYQSNQPHGFALNLAGHCNAKCSYCPQSLTDVPKEYIDRATVRRLLAATENVPTYFQLGTRGENLLHPGFFEIIREIRRNNVKHYITLNTNGRLLTPDFALRVLTSGIDQLIFSLQSMNPVIYRQLTNYDRLDKILRNMTTTVGLNQGLEKKVLIGIQYLDTPENRPYYEEFEKFWAAYDVYTYTQKLHNWGNKFDQDTYAPVKRYPCLALWLYPVVSHRGNLCSCFADFYEENVFGSLDQTSLTAIWNGSERRKTMMQEHLNSEWDKNGLCRSCRGYQEFENIFIEQNNRFRLPEGPEKKEA
ncbi:MAG: radical SAM protein [Desulfobacteraceae bacterium]|nr:MAG: radical SAM protein [Desulfobacteraceae bacterium]